MVVFKFYRSVEPFIEGIQVNDIGVEEVLKWLKENFAKPSCPIVK